MPSQRLIWLLVVVSMVVIYLLLETTSEFNLLQTPAIGLG